MAQRRPVEPVRTILFGFISGWLTFIFNNAVDPYKSVYFAVCFRLFLLRQIERQSDV
jgi:hypothetical protein